MQRIKKRAAALAMTMTLAVSGIPSCAFAAATPAAAQTGAVTPSPTPTLASPADAATVATNGIEGWPKADDIYSTVGCLMDADTGAVLYDKGMNQQMFPASTTKVMTCLLALEYGKLDDTVTVTQTGVNYAVSGSSNLNTQVGEQFKLEDMLYAMMLKSANDIATTIGEHIGGGSIDKFVAMMNDKARELGCTNTHFANACGMPDDQHYTTAHDMALIGRAALQYPLFCTIIHTPSYTIPATNMTAQRTVTTHNALLIDPNYMVDGIIGGKTGYTDAARSCLISFVEREGRTLICMTMHAQDGGYACLDHKALYTYGFGSFTNEAIPVGGGTSTMTVTLPQTAAAADCTVDVKDAEAEDGEEQVALTAMYEGQAVGETVMAKAAYEKTGEAASTEEEPASGMSEASESTGTNVSENRKSGVTMDFRRLAETKSGLAILIFGILVLAGIAAIVITLIVRRRRR
ncbi:MAG: D-alanyl-D-alanine carboxypeptidase family protein [Lachnospiraceae bacterium]|nr:D-alanyl-D-alanine carboxypeptidase family protein [Lachnospiraceae bacterium]